MQSFYDQSDDEFGDLIDWDDAQQDLEATNRANGISPDDIDHLLKDA